MMLPWFHNDFSESIGEVSHAIAGKFISHGRVCRDVELTIGQLFNKEVCLVSSGTAALWIIFKYLKSFQAEEKYGLSRRNKIIIQARTWIATVNAAIISGFEPIIIDMDQDGSAIDIASLRSQVCMGEVAAVVVTHMNGRIGDMESIKDLCLRENIFLVEDCAQSLGSALNGQSVGTFGHAAILSFSVTDLISGGQGGAVITADEELVRFVRAMCFQGGTGQAFITSGGDFDRIGFNLRYTDILATIVKSQFNSLSDRISHVWHVYENYARELSSFDGITLLKNRPGEVPVYVEALVNNRLQFIANCNDAGIEVRPFYPPVSEACFLDNKFNCLNADALVSRGVYLPCGPSIDIADVARACHAISLALRS